jgi:hypothetical protein
MQKDSVEAVVRALNDSGVRYLIAGGLAVVAHGFLRFTADVDMILDLDPENLRRAMAALKSLGYRPRAPVPIEDFADSEKRASWIADKGLKVFSLQSDRHPATEIDVFVECPVDFAAANGEAHWERLSKSGVEAAFLDYGRLVELKRAAGRPKDLDDIAQLRAARGEGG